MKRLGKLAAAGIVLALIAACDPDGTGELAEQVEDTAAMRADAVEAEADALEARAQSIDSRAEALDERAEQIRDTGESRAAAIEAGDVNADAMSKAAKEKIIDNEAPAVR